jgi:glycosyltransferase involved in cell wall biosynthesis
MAEAILDIVSNPDLYRTFRANASERVRHAFQLGDAMGHYGQLYSELLSTLPPTRKSPIGTSLGA